MIHTIVLVHVPDSFRECETVEDVKRKLRGQETAILKNIYDSILDAVKNNPAETMDELIARMKLASGELGQTEN